MTLREMNTNDEGALRYQFGNGKGYSIFCEIFDERCHVKQYVNTQMKAGGSL